MLDILKGIDVPPRLVGIARGAVEAAVLAALAVIGANVDEIASWLPALPHLDGVDIATASLLWFVVRWLESEADQRIDPDQNRRTNTGQPPRLLGL